MKYDAESLNSRFGFMHPQHFEDVVELGVFWQRPHAGSFIYGRIEVQHRMFKRGLRR
jgi:hypothetical protein